MEHLVRNKWRSVYDLNAWILLILDFLALPHSWRPYVHIGFIRYLYIRSFVFSFVCLLEINVFSIRKSAFNASLLDLIWCDQLRRQPITTPRYSTVWDVEICILSRTTSEQGGIRRVNIVCVDLDWLSLNRHFYTMLTWAPSDFGSLRRQ